MKEIEQHINTYSFSKALALCDEQLFQGDSNVSVMIARGWCLHKIGFGDEAKDVFDRVVNGDVCTLKEISYDDVMRVYDFFWSVTAYDKLIDVCVAYHHRYPQEPTVLRRLAAAHSRLAEYRLAAIYYRRALKADKQVSTEYNLGLTLLQLGEYEEGLALYEKRHEVNNNILTKSVFSIPRWSGEPIKGKGIIVWCEQGLGDVIQFSRYITLLAEKGARVALLLTPQYASLAKLLSTLSGANEVVVISEGRINLVGAYHYHMPLMSAMHHFSLRPNTIPVQAPYLSAPLGDESPWGGRLASLSGIKVGLVWSTLVEKRGDIQAVLADHLKDEKSVPFSMLNDLLSVDGVSFVNLKFPISQQERKELEASGVAEFSAEIAHFSDTASLIDQLDMVISIDTSVVHLAGAMGKPTINLLPYDSDWRWQQHRDDSPWYPSMRLYRQIYRNQWDEVIGRVTETLKKAVIHHGKTGCISINL